MVFVQGRREWVPIQPSSEYWARPNYQGSPAYTFSQLSELKWQTLLLKSLNFQTLWSFFFIFYFIFAGIPSLRQRRGASQVHHSGCTEKPSYKAFPGWFHRKCSPWFASFLKLWCPKPHKSVPLASSHGRWVFPFFFCESDLNIFFLLFFYRNCGWH